MKKGSVNFCTHKKNITAKGTLALTNREENKKERVMKIERERGRT